MAIFNPQVQAENVRDPNYFKYSDSISQPKSDTSGAITGAAVGAAIEGVAGIADSVVKGIIKDDVYARVDAEREAFSTALTNTRDYGNPAGPPREVASPVGPNGPVPAPVDILADNKTTVPNAISNGIAKASNVQAAMNGNKISETTYIQRLGDIAKSLRTSYPGYREYIDQEISKITGINPANAYINSIIQDINRQSTSADSEQKFWRNKIVESGYPGADEILAKYQQDGNSNRVMQWLSDNNAVRSNLQLKKAVFESNQNDKTTLVSRGEDYANTVATQAATRAFYNTQKYVNGDMSAADIADKLADLSRTPGAANDEAYQELSARYAALHTQAYNVVQKELFTRSKNPDGTYNKSVAEVIGVDKAKKILDDTVGAVYGKTREFIADKQFGPAYTVQNQAAAVVNNATMKVLKDPSVGATVATLSVMNKLAPNFAPILQGKLLGAGLDKDLSDLVKQQVAQSIAQTGGKYLGIDGNIYSFKQSMEELEQVNNLRGQASVPGQAVKNLMEVKQILTSPDANPEAFDNVIKYLYDPKVNKGSLDKIMDDYYDPTRREMVRGRSSAFADLTSPEITAAVRKSSAQNWSMYTKWAKEEFATQMGERVRDLNDIEKGVEYKIVWNNDSKQLELKFGSVRKDTEGQDVYGIAASFLNSSYRTITNLNKGLANMANLAKAEGSSVDAYLFRILKENGYSPTKEVNGVPAQIMRALIVGNGGKVKE